MRNNRKLARDAIKLVKTHGLESAKEFLANQMRLRGCVFWVQVAIANEFKKMIDKSHI